LIKPLKLVRVTCPNATEPISDNAKIAINTDLTEKQSFIQASWAESL